MTNWSRKIDASFPLTYKEFSGRVPGPDGEIRQYRIQDVPDDKVDEVMHHVLTGFARDEPLNNCVNLVEDQDALKEMNVIWRYILEERLSLVCYEILKTGETKLAGFNILYGGTDHDPSLVVNSPKFKKVLCLVEYVMKSTNACRDLQIDAYLGAMGLYVAPGYRGEGLGLELLKAREPLCKAVGLPATVTTFTSIISQILAERAGFKNLFEIPYEDLVKIDPKYYIEGIEKHTKNVRLMYIKY